MNEAHYQINFYVPTSHCESVKMALFKAGAGKLRGYQECAWQTRGTGQFRLIGGSKPFIGEKDKFETMEEYKVEMICNKVYLNSAIHALKQAHPYEEPAYFIIKHANLG